MNEEYATTEGTGEVDNRPLIERIGDKVNVTVFVSVCNHNCSVLFFLTGTIFFVRPLSCIELEDTIDSV